MVEADGYVEGAFNDWDMVRVALDWGIDFKLADWRQQSGICIGLPGCVRRLAHCSCVLAMDWWIAIGFLLTLQIGNGLTLECGVDESLADWSMIGIRLTN